MRNLKSEAGPDMQSHVPASPQGVRPVGAAKAQIVKGQWPRDTDAAWQTAVDAVDSAGTYLAKVTRWLAGRQAFGASLLAHPVPRQRLAAAAVALYAAQAALREGQAEVAIAAAAECADICQLVHAAAGMLAPEPNIVRRALDVLPVVSHEPPLLAEFRPDLARRIDEVLRTCPDSSARAVAKAIDMVIPSTDSALEDDLLVAEALARNLPPGLAARVLTHRQVVSTYSARSDLGSAVSETSIETDVLLAIAVTEPQGGSDLSAMATRLVPCGQGHELSGVKTFVAGGADCDRVLVAAKLADEVTLVWVDPRRPEVSVTPLDARAWRGVGFAELEFNRYAIDPRDVHQAPGYAALSNGLTRERLVLAALQFGYAQRWLPDTPEPLRAGFSARLSAARLLIVSALTQAEKHGLLPAASSMAKLACCEAAADIATARARAPRDDRNGKNRDRRSIDSDLDDEASARACLFAAGTIEINREIVAAAILPTYLSMGEKE